MDEGGRRTVAILADLSRRVPGWAEAVSRLEAAGFEVVDPGRRLTDAEAAAAVRDADVILVGGVHPVAGTVLRAARRLRLVARQGVGVDNIDVETASALGVAVCNTPGCNAEAVADHTFALILELFRDLRGLDARVRAGRGWDDGWPPRLVQLAGKTLGVVGTGNVGSRVARRAVAGFGMRVLANDLVPDPVLVRELGIEYLPLDDLLPDVDILTLHVPLTPLTRGMIGADRLRALRPSALVVNTSRGGVVDEGALVGALAERRLLGAGVDVFEVEPSTDSPLYALPNTVLTPHCAAQSVESSVNARAWSVDNILAFFNARAVNVVNAADLGKVHNTEHLS